MTTPRCRRRGPGAQSSFGVATSGLLAMPAFGIFLMRVDREPDPTVVEGFHRGGRAQRTKSLPGSRRHEVGRQLEVPARGTVSLWRQVIKPCDGGIVRRRSAG